jgi:hypothetical protein
MKTAIYIEDGTVQLVLTPETDFEKDAIGKFNGPNQAELFNGTFYDCRGGWVKQSEFVQGGLHGVPPYRDHSLIIRKTEPPTRK